ncbi:putative PurR-regulated permease PerM [Murinocardiopsis flavida]|uniref:Putative PurR-regulated permease PerM n=1 Tax=Murinocardiopsis flavida TaxID=645275 RepID=A0A2P8DLP2_9ACTN|nr:putative PurR-regulated permease PerM [Murinocardiopsis flavida]
MADDDARGDGGGAAPQEPPESQQPPEPQEHPAPDDPEHPASPESGGGTGATAAEGDAAQPGEGAASPGPGVAESTPDSVMLAARRHVGEPRGELARLNFFKIGFTGALGVLVAWLLVDALVGAASILIYILVALFLAVGLNPTIVSLNRWIPRWAAILIVCFALVAFVAAFVWTLVPPLTEQISEFVADVPYYINELRTNPFLADLDRRFKVLEKFQDLVLNAKFGEQVFGGIIGVGAVVVNSLFATFTVLILTLFFLSSLPAITEMSYRLVPRSRRAGVRELGDEILQRIGSYIGGQLVIALVGGVVAYVFLLIIGSQYALTLGLIVAVTALIPLVGTTIGALVASLVVGVGDWWLGLISLAFFLVYQQIESYVISPRIMQRSVDVAPTATITAALLGGALLGLVGALIAIPTAAAITLILKRVVFPRLEEG